MGLSDDRLLCAHQPLRHAAGLHVLNRLPAPAGHRRHSRLGSFPFPLRRARPSLFRRHAPLRARRPPAGVSSRLEEFHLQLRPPRGSQFSAQQRPVLAGEVPRRRTTGGWRRFHALSRLLPQGRRLGSEPLWGTGKFGRDHLPAAVQPRGVPPLSGRADRGGRIDGLADGLTADEHGRPGFRIEVGHGLDARYAGLHVA